MTVSPSAITSKHQSGFTLFELLVVIIIISISFAVFLSINFSSTRSEDRIHKEASRLYRLLSFAHEQSVIRGEEYGIHFQPDGYYFMQYIEEDNAWIAIDDRLLTEKKLTDNIELELAVEQTEIVLDEAPPASEDNNPEITIKPQVFLLSSGETTPDFIARFFIPGENIMFEIHGTTDGKYELKKSE